MGKWTPNYVDDVLHFKIKNLVSGAIKRSALEKTEPTISYENFVNELDTGDSFTTSLIDILVKELAERRTRPSVSDRRFIADRSAKSLRLLATPLRVYRDRSIGRYHHNRRSATLADYLSAPPVEVDTEEDEDIFDNMLDNGSNLEGARTNSELYDAYGNHDASTSRAVRSPSPPTDGGLSPTSGPQRSGTWSVSSGIPPATTLTRQASIRRPLRSRTVDFNDFTLHRRSVTRDSQIARGEISEIPDTRENSWTRHPQATRRFFPFVRTRRHDSPDNYSWATENTDINDDHDSYAPTRQYNTSWFNLAPPSHLEPVTIEEVLADATVSDERAHSSVSRVAFPRLRRGGLRAPESILSRHASPTIPATIQAGGVPDIPFSRESDDAAAVVEPPSYPTPSVGYPLPP